MRAVHQHGSGAKPNNGKRVRVGDWIATVESACVAITRRILRQYVEHQDSRDHEPDVA